MKVWIVSSSKVSDSKYLQLASNVANIFCELDYELLCGGISSSMMKEVFEEFKKNNKKITCVTLTCYNENFVNIDPIIVDTTFDRTKKLYEDADVIVFLPGGSGSLSEILASIEEFRTQESNKKLILYNEDGFYDNLISVIENLVNLGFNENKIFKKFEIANTISELKKKVSE